MGDRHAQMRDAGVKVVQQAGDGAGHLDLVFLDQTFGQLAGDGSARRLIGGSGAGLELVDMGCLLGSPAATGISFVIPHAEDAPLSKFPASLGLHLRP